MELTLLGAIAMACFVATLLFAHFWKTTGDRFFLFFALSFGLEGASRTIMGVTKYTSEQEPLLYVIRLLAFLIIIWAIIDKNLVRKNPS